MFRLEDLVHVVKGPHKGIQGIIYASVEKCGYQQTLGITDGLRTYDVLPEDVVKLHIEEFAV